MLIAMISRVFIGTVIVCLVSCGSSINENLSPKDKAIKAKIEKDAVTDVLVGNSKIKFTTPGIKEVARKGKAVVPQVIRIMKHPATGFDTFVRCYAACQEILSKVDPDAMILWYGGVELEDAILPSKERTTRFLPSG